MSGSVKHMGIPQFLGKYGNRSFFLDYRKKA